MKGLINRVSLPSGVAFSSLIPSLSFPSFFLPYPWASGKMLENPPVTNCGFVYLLFTCVVGFIGLILFSVAAKKYKYRRRDEGMFVSKMWKKYDC